jgi:hypothetical protein
MAETITKSKIVFSIYPNANGFGYVYLENARKLLDHGTIRVNPINNIVLLGRIKKLLGYIRPSIVIAVDPEGKTSRIGMRVKELIKKIIIHSEKNQIPIFQISRDQIRDVFSQFGASTKYEISQMLIAEFKELELKLPKKRKIWAGEDRNMAIFDALSLGLTWFYLND